MLVMMYFHGFQSECISLNFVPYTPGLPCHSPTTTTKICIISHRNLGETHLDGRFSSGSPMKLRSGCWPELWSSEGLTRPGGAASQVAHSHSWQVGDGCCQEDSVHSLRVSQRLLRCPYNMVVDFCQTKQDTRKKGGNHNVFYHLFSEITHLHFHHILLAIRTNPDTV